MSDQPTRQPISPDTTQWVVLVVDDKPDNLTIVRTALSFHGAQVYTAANGIEGLELLKNVIPSFILLDLAMPYMDGWEMLRRVRADPALAHLWVIALTAHAMDGDRERVAQAGFDGYISKPFDLFTFLGQIRQALNLT